MFVSMDLSFVKVRFFDVTVNQVPSHMSALNAWLYLKCCRALPSSSTISMNMFRLVRIRMRCFIGSQLPLYEYVLFYEHLRDLCYECLREIRS